MEFVLVATIESELWTLDEGAVTGSDTEARTELYEGVLSWPGQDLGDRQGSGFFGTCLEKST